MSLVPPVHVCLLEEDLIVASLPDLLALAGQKYYSSKSAPLATTFITGPSRTADIELSLTLGVHGPRELHTLLIGGR
jgi:L-lactate dehydrogenase complex protein LldG